MTAKPIVWSDSLATEYTELFSTCEVRPNRLQLTTGVAERIEEHQPRYERIAKLIDCPWWLVGLI
ncbi:MAG: hypothetical protein KGL39_50285, partial [Patescibacteria group bacterium]|nr:hypothetical protein [Patescibacteria group bacterium]